MPSKFYIIEKLSDLLALFTLTGLKLVDEFLDTHSPIVW